MIFSSLLVSVLLAVSTFVQASPVEPREDDDFKSRFLDILNKNGLTTLSDIYAKTFKTEESDQIVDLLKSGEITLLAPRNDAFDPDHPSIDANGLLYNTIYGNIDKGFKSSGNSTSRKRGEQSRSNASSGFSFPQRGSRKRAWGLVDGNQIQVVDKYSTSRKRWNNEPLILIDRAIGSAKVVGRFTFKKIIILIIDTVLTIPTRISDLLCKPLVDSAPDGFVKFGGGLQKVGLLDEVENAPRTTIFVPIDAAFKDIDGLSDDELTDILKNHIVYNDTPVYSTLFPFIGKADAKSGKELKFIVDENVPAVKCGQNKANMLRSDITTANGVIHVIDKVLTCHD
ncbi:hypothetical protein FRC07_010600 [Ceratobasidium sp. 392]|nr:hypothetical protein FRC07_010600 [Ceratobasidium sp. 392]